MGSLSVLAALCVLVPAAPARAAVSWQGDLSQALEQARRQGKTVLLDYYAAWCPPCQALSREVFSTDALSQVQGKLVFAHQDMDQLRGGDLLKRYPATELPTVWLIAPDGRAVARHLGYDTKAEFLSFLDKTLAGQDPAKDLARRLAESPDDPDVLDEAYTAALDKGDAAKARELLDKARSKRDDWEEAYEAMRYEQFASRLQAKDTDYAALDALVDRYLEEFPKSYFAPSAVALRAKNLRARGRDAEADALMADLPQRFPDQSPAYWRVLEYARLYSALDGPAREALKKGLERYPKQEHFLVQAVLYLKASDKPRARTLARTLVELKPDNGYYQEILRSLQ